MTDQAPYFVDHKRGEVNELKTLLRNPAINKNPVKKREVIKKVIAYMTLGIDVSKLFSEMVMAASTKDLVQKKMVYHYLSLWSRHKADLALLAINTLQKDCKDQDPMVRGLALRSLCSLRVPGIVEYCVLPIRHGLKDVNGYVRGAAALGCAKIFRIAPATIKDSDLIDVLYNMLKDKEPEVVSNSISALNEILASEGGMAVNQQIILYLLARLRQFNEWGQCVVLDLVAKYSPASEDQMFDIMSHLDDRLRHSNCAVVLGAIKVFLNFTRNLPAVHAEVYKRLRAPLLTLMTGGSTERSYTVLAHIRLLVSRSPGMFDPAFKHFFLRYNDPLCVKKLKVSILTDLANTTNQTEIMTELSEYATDVDMEIARAAIKGIAKIAIRLESSVDESIDHLLSFLDLNTGYVSAEACIAIKDLLRKYPDRYEDVIPALQKCLKTVDDTETEGKVAVVWMIGEYGEKINQAPYILEPLIEGFKDEPSSAVRMELLTSTMKLFFRRPPEVHKMLGRLLKQAISDTTKIDVRDRGLLYYRLLKLDVHEAARIVNCPKVIVDVFAEEEDQDHREKIFKEFNSLSVIYVMPSEKFVRLKGKEEEEDFFDDEDDKKKDEKKGDKKSEGEGPGAGKEKLQTSTLLEKDDEEPITTTTPSSTATTTATTTEKEVVEEGTTVSETVETEKKAQVLERDLLSFGLDETPETIPEVKEEQPAKPTLTFVSPAGLDSKSFQGKWTKLPANVFELILSQPGTGPARAIEPLLNQHRLVTMAKGEVASQSKYYFYSQDPSGNYYFLEVLVDLTSGSAKLTAKNEGTEASVFVDLLKQALHPIVKST